MTLSRRGFLKYSAAVSLGFLSGGLLGEMMRAAAPTDVRRLPAIASGGAGRRGLAGKAPEQ